MGLSTKEIYAYKSKSVGGYSNFTEDERIAAQDTCESVYETKGADAYNSCVDTELNKLKNDGASWKDVLNNAFQFGSTAISQTGKGGGSRYSPDQSLPNNNNGNNNTGFYVLGGIALLGLVGFGLYKLSQK